MFLYLLILFTAVPLLELWLLIRIGSAIGAGSTMAVVLLTGVIGAALARREGYRTMLRINESVARGQLPAVEMVEGVLIFIAGVVLVTPGVITDALGFALLVPPLRAWIGRSLTNYFKSRITIVGPGMNVSPEPDDDFIDVEYREVTDDERRRL